MSDDLIREVNQALQQHRWQVFWRKAGRKLAAIAAVLIIASIALVLWEQQQAKQRQAQSDTLLKVQALLSDATPQSHSRALALLDGMEASNGRAALRALFTAALHQRAGEPEKAAAALREALPAAAIKPDLLAAYGCVLLSGLGEPATPACGQGVPPVWAPLQAELRAMQWLQQGRTQDALAILPQDVDDPMQARRLADLRAYLNASPALATQDADDAQPE